MGGKRKLEKKLVSSHKGPHLKFSVSEKETCDKMWVLSLCHTFVRPNRC